MKKALLTALTAAILAATATVSYADMANSRFGLHVIRIEPNGDDAEQFSAAAWGGNIEAILVPSGIWNALGIVVNVSLVELDSKTTVFRDRLTGLRTEQQTSQTYTRVAAGARVGHQGHGFFRPYAGANLAINIFNIDTDVVIPDDSDRENEIRQDLKSKTETAFGFEMALGTEFNFGDRWYIDLGGKYIKTFEVPQQLGDEARKIHPQYFEIYAGAGVTFGFLSEE